MLARFPVHTTLPTKDLNRARQFYEGVLGLTPSLIAEQGIVYTVGGGTALEVYPSGAGGKAEHTLMTWLVDDIYAAVNDLRRRGVTFEEYDFPGLKTVNGIAEVGTEYAAWFKDPDGNILAVSQRR